MRKLLLATTALLALTGAASAGPVYTLTSFNELDAGGSGFNVSDSALGVNYSGYAGPLQLNTNVSTGGTQSFLAYCMDLIHILTTGQTYSLGSVGINGLSLNSSQIHQIDAAANIGFASSDALVQAAAQLAIWRIEYGSGLNVTTTGMNHTQELTDYNTILTEVMAAGGDGGVDAFVPTNPGATQQMIVQVAAVPEPSTWAMMLLGFAGIVVMGARNRRRAKHPFRLA